MFLRLQSALADQRGVALPLALIVLTLLTSLSLAFLALGAMEPPIATNLRGGEQALALAEAGIERSIWALSNPTVDTAGAGTKLTDLTQIPAAYNNQLLFSLSGIATGAYAITISGTGPTTLVARGYILRNGVAVPGDPSQLVQSDIAAQRGVQLQFNGTVGGPASPFNVKLPGALTVAGTVELQGNSLVDGLDQSAGVPNGCTGQASVTIRDRTQLPDGTWVDNTTKIIDPAVETNRVSGTTCTGCNVLTAEAFNQYLFTDAQLAALKSLAQSLSLTSPPQATYIKPTSSSQFNLTLTDGLTFIDTVNGADLGNPPDASKIASVKITGGNNSGWLIVMGSIQIDGDVTYNGFVYAHNDIQYRGTGTGGVYGGMLSANKIDAVRTKVDTSATGNSKIYFDCQKIANGGSSFGSGIQNALNSPALVPGSWREVLN